MKTFNSMEACGCIFTTVEDDEGYSETYLTKCHCKNHYNQQLKAEWYDHEGFHSIVRNPAEVVGLLPLEKKEE